MNLPVAAAPSDAPTPPPQSPLAGFGGGWDACLDVAVARVAGRSAPVRCEHRGPLRLQKALWPEGTDPVHLLLLHPPGGIAAGDRLQLRFVCDARAQALVTTPGAGKWYRADAGCRQDFAFEVGPAAALEWLPQETILHDGCDGAASLHFALHGDARAIGTDIVVLGRRAHGERLASARYRQHLRVTRDGRPLLDERMRIAAGMPFATSAVMGEDHVTGLLWASAPAEVFGDGETLVARVEAALDACQPGIGGATLVQGELLLARVVGSSPERVRAALQSAWSVLRPVVVGRPARAPRIWAT